MLTEAVGTHWHALVRDVIALGKDPDDMFITKDLSFAKMVSIVVAAPPSSSVRWYRDGGWTRTDHILANQQEHAAGMSSLTSPYNRPGATEDYSPATSSKFFPADAMTWEEMDRRDALRAQQPPPTTRSQSRVFGPNPGCIK